MGLTHQQDMCTFYKYYAGEAIAPMLTIFIGGNHEASNYLQVLSFLLGSAQCHIVSYSVADPDIFGPPGTDPAPDPSIIKQK
jgi:hypothetical protein